MASSSLPAPARKPQSVKKSDTVTLSRQNYDKCLKVLQEQDARIKILENELRENEAAYARRILEKVKKANSGHVVGPEVDEPEVDYKERCRLLQMILDRQNVDVGNNLELCRLEVIIPHLQSDIQSKDALIKDLRYSLETTGGLAELYSEARLKNDHLQKIISQKDNLLQGHQKHVEELEKTLKDKAASELIDNQRVATGVCNTCESLQADVLVKSRTIQVLRSENSRLEDLNRKKDSQLQDLESGRHLAAEIERLTAELSSMTSLNKDLTYSLEGRGGDAEGYSEARVKNARLEKIIRQQKNERVGCDHKIKELQNETACIPSLKTTIEQLRTQNEQLKKRASLDTDETELQS